MRHLQEIRASEDQKLMCWKVACEDDDDDDDNDDDNENDDHKDPSPALLNCAINWRPKKYCAILEIVKEISERGQRRGM